jgi:hypothetical protein
MRVHGVGRAIGFHELIGCAVVVTTNSSVESGNPEVVDGAGSQLGHERGWLEEEGVESVGEGRLLRRPRQG